MIKVAFLGSNYSMDWIGGVNYLSNLCFAISKMECRKIEPVIFLGVNANSLIVNKLSPNVKIIQNSIFDRNSPKWFLSKIIERIFGTNFLVERILLKNDIFVISHSNIIRGYKNFIKINWITDFQHIHFPGFFSVNENNRRNNHFLNILKQSDRVIVSSFDAYEDAKKFCPMYVSKLKVLQFTSQIPQEISFFSQHNLDRLQKKYGFDGIYFYLPNQLWKHKNHMLIFKAIKLLKDNGIEVLLICSGSLNDYRDPQYIEEVNLFLNKNELKQNIKLLGLIDYEDVLHFMKYSLAVINPSLFEGWSSTVEECKSMGKDMILSDIPIHREQNSKNSLYFNPNNLDEAASILKSVWMGRGSFKSDNRLEQETLNNLNKRTLAFASKYQSIILEAVSSR